MRREVLAMLAMTAVFQSAASAQTPAESRAARETMIDGLRLLEPPVRGTSFGFVERDTQPGGGRYHCGALTRSQSASAAATVTRAMARLPDASLAKLRLRYVILCSRALASGQPIGGIPVPPLDLLMLDVGSHDHYGLHVQQGFLHELFHLVEFRFNSYHDAAWQFSGYVNRYGPEYKRAEIGSGKPGFLNAYSLTFPHEERAELFAALLLQPAQVSAHVKAHGDDVLRRKILYIIEKCDRLMGLRISL